jgi:hypothetical protein
MDHADVTLALPTIMEYAHNALQVHSGPEITAPSYADKTLFTHKVSIPVSVILDLDFLVDPVRSVPTTISSAMVIV